MSMLSRLAALGGAVAAAGIQYVGGTTGSGPSPYTVSLTNLTGGTASRPAIGDLVLIFVGVAGSTAIPATPTVGGYTQLLSAGRSDTYSTVIYAGYKILTAADTSVSVTYAGATTLSSTTYVSVWRNFDATYPFDIIAKTASSANSILANPPAITPITTGGYVVAAGAGANNGYAFQYSSSDLTDFKTIAANNSFDSLIGGGYKQWASGAFDPAAFTCSLADSGTFSWAAASIALRPAGVRTVFPSIVGSNYSNLAGTVTVPSHQAGDWIVFLNGTTGNTSPPALTSGFTNITTFTNNNATAAEDKSARVQYIISDGTITTLSCSTYGGVVILRNVTALASSSVSNGSSTTAASTFSVSLNPTIPGSIYIFAGYDPDNYRSASSASGLTSISRFGAYAQSDAIPSPISGSLTYWVNEFPAYCGIEFY